MLDLILVDLDLIDIFEVKRIVDCPELEGGAPEVVVLFSLHLSMSPSLFSDIGDPLALLVHTQEQE